MDQPTLWPPTTPRVTCPDGGTCHHRCAAVCWRVANTGPLSGVYPADVWPADVRRTHAADQRGQAHPGAVARDAAIDRAEANAPDEWWAIAWSCVWAVAATLSTFTTDDVWAALDDRDAPPPPEPRAMGAIMRRAKRERIATPTDRTTLSNRPACHRRPVRVWKATR